MSLYLSSFINPVSKQLSFHFFLSSSTAHLLDDQNYGFCSSCGFVSPDLCEPDASDYTCPECSASSLNPILASLLNNNLTILSSAALDLLIDESHDPTLEHLPI